MHHSVGRLQIETAAGSTDGQQKDESLAVWRIELLDGLLPARQRKVRPVSSRYSSTNTEQLASSGNKT